MVSLVRGEDGALAAYPNAKGSGAVTAFSQADGFIAIGPQVESVAAGTPVAVQLIGHAAARRSRHHRQPLRRARHVDRSVCTRRGSAVKALNVGSMGGLAAAKRGECDIAPIHLMDPETGEYNRPFLTPALELLPRLSSACKGSSTARVTRASTAARSKTRVAVVRSPTRNCLMVNRNAGSGTRILTDRLLNGARPPGYWSQPKSHNAVAVAVAQNRADWGIAIESVARQYGLGFIPVAGRALRFRDTPRPGSSDAGAVRFRQLCWTNLACAQH